MKGVLYTAKIAVTTKIMTAWIFIASFERSPVFDAVNYPKIDLCTTLTAGDHSAAVFK